MLPLFEFRLIKNVLPFQRKQPLFLSMAPGMKSTNTPTVSLYSTVMMVYHHQERVYLICFCSLTTVAVKKQEEEEERARKEKEEKGFCSNMFV